MKATNRGLTSRSSRRSVLKGTIVGATGLAATGGIAAGAFFVAAKTSPQGDSHAAGLDESYHHYSSPDSIQTILNVAVTAETLAVTFYKEVLNHPDWLGLGNTARKDLQAALVEEAIHREFLLKQGAKPLTTRFSFPYGWDTFHHFDKFIQTQQLLEAHFVAAYLAAVKEFAMLNRPDLALIASQIGGVEAEHRVVGRAIAGWAPANNRVFETALLNKVSDAVTALKNHGFLNTSHNSYWDYEDYDWDNSGLSGTYPSSQDLS
jgi:hypothetical protein